MLFSFSCRITLRLGEYYKGKNSGSVSNLLQKMLSLNDYRPMTHWIEQFLIDQEQKVSEHTWTTYARSLELWRLYLDSYYGETYLGELEWGHLEEFLAWWYFRHYLGRNYQEAQVLLITLENFAYWLKDKRVIQEELWQEEIGQLLKQDIQRIFDWTKKRALEDGTNEAGKCHLARDTGWFWVCQKNNDQASLSNLLTKQEYNCSLQGDLPTFLRSGDVFSGFVWRGKEKTSFLDNKSIRNLYPRAAHKYFN